MISPNRIIDNDNGSLIGGLLKSNNFNSNNGGNGGGAIGLNQ